METRAHHLLVGMFTLVAVVTGFLLVLWIGKLSIDREYVYYDIVFTDAVTGLNEGAEVRYQGINVGSVTRIRVDPSMPRGVRVTVRVQAREDVQIRDSDRASLELAGLTGLTYVLINVKEAGGEVLTKIYDEDAELPLIASEQSQLQSLFADLPTLIQTTENLLERAQAVFSQDNTDNLAKIVADIETLTNSFAEREEEIGRAVSNIAAVSDEAVNTMREATRLAAQIRSLSADIEKLVEEDASDVLNSVSDAAGGVDVVARDVSRVLRSNEDALNTFTTQGLAQVGTLVAEARELVVNLNRVARSIEDDPSRFLFGGREPVEVAPQ